MNELLPIIRRVRRPLIEPDAKPVATVEPVTATTKPEVESVSKKRTKPNEDKGED